jgi:hypothetical protein
MLRLIFRTFVHIISFIKTFSMHIGNYLRELAKKQRLTVAEISQLVNKSDMGVRKDFAKPKLHMDVVEAYAKALDFNIYEVLSQNWSGIEVSEPSEEYSRPKVADEERTEQIKQEAALSGEMVTLSFQVDLSKAARFIELLKS